MGLWNCTPSDVEHATAVQNPFHTYPGENRMTPGKEREGEGGRYLASYQASKFRDELDLWNGGSFPFYLFLSCCTSLLSCSKTLRSLSTPATQRELARSCCCCCIIALSTNFMESQHSSVVWKSFHRPLGGGGAGTGDCDPSTKQLLAGHESERAHIPPFIPIAIVPFFPFPLPSLPPSQAS